MVIKAPRGTRDFLPPDTQVWHTLEKAIRNLYRCYNYQEIRTPIFEETDLFVRGVGDTTDIVEKEMYTFTDKGGRSLTLRPEGTASVVRAYIEHKLHGQAQPFKFFYFGPMFRYERPQAGRYRQHHQTGIEVLGGDTPLIDAEVISLGLDILGSLGLQKWELHLNSIGCQECRPPYIQSLKAYGLDREKELCHVCVQRLQRNPLRILDCKEAACKEALDGAPLIHESLCKGCKEHFEAVQMLLGDTGQKYRIDPFLVRGLDYYTRTAFEVKSKGLGAQDTIFGGGRYDGLSEQLGGSRAPGMGFGMGMERLVLALEQEKQELLSEPSIDVFLVVTESTEGLRTAWPLLQSLRKQGFQAEMDLLLRKFKGQFKQANRLSARYTVILGEEELEQKKVNIKDMVTGEQKQVAMDGIVDYIRQEGRQENR